MEAFWVWVDREWFTLVQSIGIIGGLWMTTATLRGNSRSRRISDSLVLSQQHRDLWKEVHRRSDLQRLFAKEVDLVAQPIAIAEEEYLNLVIVHFQTTWMIAKEGSRDGLDALASDTRAFFSLPIPRRVWERTKGERPSRFVKFIDASLSLL